jgi:hypothetical protein
MKARQGRTSSGSEAGRDDATVTVFIRWSDRNSLS